MAIQLVKTSTTDEYSPGSGQTINSDPVVMGTVIIDETGTPATYTTPTVVADVRATTYLYTGVTVTVVNDSAAINYEISLNGTTGWGQGPLSMGTGGTMDATGGTVTDQIYVRTIVQNAGTTPAGINNTAKLRLDATENQ